MNNSTINYSHCSLTTLEQNGFEYFIKSQISPIVIIVTFVTNIIICIVLTKPHMISPTNVILLRMAIANLLTGLVPLPIYLAKLDSKFILSITIFKAFSNYYLTVVFPTIFHTAASWLTVILAIQRYFYIRMPLVIHHVWTTKSAKICIYIVFLISTLSHGITFTFYFSLDSEGNVVKCFTGGQDVLVTYYFLRVCLINVIPCLVLAIFTALLIRALGQAHRNHCRLIQKSNPKTLQTQKSDSLSNSISKMLVVVLILFLIVEVPTGATIAAYTVCKTFQFDLDDPLFTMLITICDLAVLISYPCNFVIYCIMSKPFRNTLSSVICCFKSEKTEDPQKMLNMNRLLGPNKNENSPENDCETKNI